MREVLGALRLLDEVGRNDGKGVTVEDRFAHQQVAFQPLDRARQDQFGLDVELLRQLPLPLFGQGRGTEHGQTADLAAVEQLTSDEAGFDGLADANVVGDQHAHRIELQRHHQRHELVGPGLDGDAPETAKRAGGGAGGEAGRVAQQAARGEVAEVFPARKPERRRLDRLHRRQDPGDLFVETAHRAQHQQFVGRVGQHHPLAAACSDEGAGLGEALCAHVSKYRPDRVLR